MSAWIIVIEREQRGASHRCSGHGSSGYEGGSGHGHSGERSFILCRFVLNLAVEDALIQVQRLVPCSFAKGEICRAQVCPDHDYTE